jgi:hypothetical protein
MLGLPFTSCGCNERKCLPTRISLRRKSIPTTGVDDGGRLSRLLHQLDQNQYSAAYCTLNCAGEFSHVLGGCPPAVFNRYTALIEPTVPSDASRYNQGTFPVPLLVGADEGAGLDATFFATTTPRWTVPTSRSKTGVVGLEKKW